MRWYINNTAFLDLKNYFYSTRQGSQHPSLPLVTVADTSQLKGHPGKEDIYISWDW